MNVIVNSLPLPRTHAGGRWQGRQQQQSTPSPYGGLWVQSHSTPTRPPACAHARELDPRVVNQPIYNSIIIHFWLWHMPATLYVSSCINLWITVLLAAARGLQMRTYYPSFGYFC